MRVLITGAAGEIGSQIVEEISSLHDLCLIERIPVPGHMSIVADLCLDSGLNSLETLDWVSATNLDDSV